MINFNVYFLQELLDYAKYKGEVVREELKDHRVQVYDFYYRIADILNEVDKRTSYIGMNKLTEQGGMLYEQFRMSRDESPLAESLLENAIESIHDSICCYGRTIAQSVRYTPDAEEQTMLEQYGKDVAITFGDATLDKVDGINVLTIPYTLTTANATDLGEGESVLLNVKVVYKKKNLLGLIEEVEIMPDTDTRLTALGEGELKLTIDLEDGERTDGLHPEEFVSCDHVSAEKLKVWSDTPTEIAKGVWVKYVKLDGTKLWYVTQKDCTSNADIASGCFKPEINDMRNSVHYVMQRPHMFNDNALSGIDNAIHNALVTHIMWHWLQTISAYDDASMVRAEYEEHIANLKKRFGYRVNPMVGRTRWF